MGVDHSTPSDTEKRVQERKEGAVGPQDWERGLAPPLLTLPYGGCERPLAVRLAHLCVTPGQCPQPSSFWFWL